MRTFFLSLFTTLLAFSFCSESRTITQFSGKAYNAKSEHIFTEEYTIEKEGDKIFSVTTTFKDPKGGVIADMVSDFTHHAFVPKVSFQKAKDPFCYGSSFLESSYEIFKTTARNVRKSKKLNVKENMVAGPGFYFFVLEHLESLLKGNQTNLTFIQPNRLSSYSFDVSATCDSENPEKVKVNLTSNQALLKAFIPDIELVINAKEKTLVSYKGLSGFLSDGTDLKQVRIDYSSPKQIDHHSKDKKDAG